jgi:5-methylthioribose kinase
MPAQRLLTDETLPDYLRERGLAGPGEPISVEVAGDGNINWVRRVRIGGARPRSLVLKQARPALERFPQYSAPTERIVFEARYSGIAAPHDADGVCPRVLAFDEAERVLALEDLTGAERLDAALARAADVAEPCATLARFLARVHRATAGDASLAARFANGAMQRLHGDHIFVLPYRENDFGLSPRLAEAAREARADARLVALAASCYERFLTPRGALVHGDVQAGNVLLLPAGGVKLLDAEIAHAGDPAFDLGTLLAHLALPAIARGDAASTEPLLRAAWRSYAEAAGTAPLADALRYAGLELTRRTIGAARVAAVASDEAGLRVLANGRSMTLEPERFASRLAA